MKDLILFITLLGISVSSQGSGGYCGAKSSAGQESFCNSLDEKKCPSFPVCTWKSEAKTINVIVEAKKSCVAKANQPDRKRFCENYDEESCKFHGSRCDWK